uniref:Methyltransferase n=1 Tax=Parastrongyloides trichosuri TaxID=131310 RepID=A0A0N5A5Y8_PARTI
MVEMNDVVGDIRPPDVLLNELGVAMVVLDHDDLHRVKSRAFAQFGFDVDHAAHPANDVAYERQTQAFTRRVLLARAPEQLEYPFMIPRRDAPAVISHSIRDPAVRLLPAADLNMDRPARLLILDGVVDQIAEDLLDRQTVVLHRRQVADRDLAARFGDLMADGVSDGADHGRHIERLGLKGAAPLARQAQDGVDQPVHLGRRGADKAHRFGRILAH